jgi:hypothetical protein
MISDGSVTSVTYSLEADEGKVVPIRTMKAYRGSHGTNPLILNVGAGHKWLITRPGRFTPGTESRFQFNGNLGKPQSRSRRLGGDKALLPLSASEARTIQPIA